MIYTITLNPAIDRILEIPGFQAGGTNLVHGERLSAGGKGINVARTLHALGAGCTAMGLAGGETGRTLVSRIAREGIPADFVDTEAETRVNLKILDPETHSTTEVNLPGASPEEVEVERLQNLLESRLRPGDTVAFTGSLPADLSPLVYHDWIMACKARRVRTALDTSGEALLLGAGAKPALIKPNLAEMETICGMKLDSMVDVLMASRKLVLDGIGMVVVSLGERGALLTTETMQLYGRAPKVKARCTMGAGDAMLAALLYGMERHMEIEDLLKLALTVSAASAAGPGGGALDMCLVDTLLSTVEIETL